MRPGRSENPNSADLDTLFSTLPHPEGWATDPSRFAKAAARRSQRHPKNAAGSARCMLQFRFDMKRKGRPYDTYVTTKGVEVDFAYVVYVSLFCLCRRIYVCNFLRKEKLQTLDQ